LSAQKERLESFCKAQGWSDYKFYIEEGISAKSDKRPVYQKMMEHVKQGKIKTVLVYKLDRIMRSIGDLDRMIKTLEEYDCAFKSATEPFDTKSATGKLFIYMVGAFAQWEIELSSERIQMALEEKVSKGQRVGNIPYPFDLGENEKLIPNEKRTRRTLEIIDKYESGMSTGKIAEYMQNTETTDKNWRPNTIMRLLKNPALCGDTRWNDKVYKNTHKGIISRERFNKIQIMLKDRADNRLKNVKSTYLFRGIIACPSCGNKLNVNRYIRKRADGSVYQSATYGCPPCSKKRQFNKDIGEKRFLNALYEYMKNVEVEEIKDVEVKNDKPNYIDRYKKIERIRERYQRAWANELMSDEEFKKRMDETATEYEVLKRKVENYEEEKPINVKEIKNVVTMFNNNLKMLTTHEKQK